MLSFDTGMIGFPLRLLARMVTLTEEAQKKVSELLSQETEDMALRVAVRPGGCSGFSYEMYFDTDKAEDDIEKLFDEVRVVVDSSSAELLTGATLDFKDGLNGAGFAIDNPNAQKSCGCGKSFS
jgi:iron-sulfur cluster assembly protein/iron-sulfur cluster insertion protein